MALLDQIREFAQQVVERYAPQEIILFGSYARGDMDVDSDVDMLIVLDHNEDNVEKAVEMRNVFHPRFPLDLLVRRPADITRRIAMNDYFIQDIVRQGVVLYDGSGS